MTAPKKKPAKKANPPVKVGAAHRQKAKPLTADTPLTPLEHAFVQEFARTNNGTQAWKAIRPASTDRSAAVSASRMLTRANVVAALDAIRAEVAAVTKITGERVVQEAWGVLTADPRELVDHVVGCCRHCHGKGHRFQRTDGELADAKAAHQAAKILAPNAKAKQLLGTFDPAGGGGFDARREPNPACPTCGGYGEGRVVIKDTRNLSKGALALYAGAKQGKEGIEVRFHSKDAATDRLMKHFGLYKERTGDTLPVVSVKDLTGRKD